VPQLDPTWFASQLFWLFVCFTILYLLLSRLVLPPLQNVIASRKEVIENDVYAAQDLKLKAEEAKLSYETILIKSREEARDLINKAMMDSKAQAEEAIKALDAQVAAQSLSASSAISVKKQELLNNLTPMTLEFTALIVEKLTQKTPSEEQVKRAANLTA
jgi:F-type H+-transporting ATPase subunit b